VTVVTSDCRQRRSNQAFPADGFGVEGPANGLGDRRGVLRTFGLDDAALQQLGAKGLLSGFEVRDLGLYGAELVDNLADREVVESGYNGCSLGHRVPPLLWVRPGGVLPALRSADCA
jgi:hypothetical protein